MQTAQPLLLVGAGRMGGALIAGWRLTGAVPLAQIWLRDPAPGPEALAAAADGARLNPEDASLARIKTVILAVKPQIWRSMAAQIAPHLHPDARLVSILAGVYAADIAAAFDGRPVARVMPTTAAAITKGCFSVWSDDPVGRTLCHSLFAPLGKVVDLAAEDQMHAATAASGSAPAYLYAFIEALEAAARGQGLNAAVARDLVRSTLAGAAALLDLSGEDPAELRRQVTSPEGTTAAALAILTGDNGLESLMHKAVAAATARSRELGARS